MRVIFRKISGLLQPFLSIYLRNVLICNVKPVTHFFADLTMVIRYNDVLSLITTLADDEGLRVSVRESVKGGLIAGLACALGGVLLGPPGLAIGGTVGGFAAAYLSREQLKPLSQVMSTHLKKNPCFLMLPTQVISDMPVERQRQLVSVVGELIRNLDPADALELIALVQGSSMLKAKIAKEMVTYFASEMNVQVQQ